MGSSNCARIISGSEPAGSPFGPSASTRRTPVGCGKPGPPGKLHRKGADLIVANDVSAPEVGFGHDTNAVIILAADGQEHEVPLTGKRAVATAVFDAVAAYRSRCQPDA